MPEGHDAVRRWPRVVLMAACAVLLMAGIFARFEHLGRDLVWHDEVYTQMFASGYGSADWQARFFDGQVFHAGDVRHFLESAPDHSTWDTLSALACDEPQHPPLYYAAARAWRALFGDGIGALRAFSACASAIGLLLFYWLALELFRERRIALAAVVMVAVSPFFMLYAREAREYALFTTLVIGASAALLRAMRRSRDGAGKTRVRRAWALYVVMLTLGFYTSLSMASVALAHAFVFVIACRHDRVALLAGVLSFGAVGLLFAPWAWAVARHWESFRASMAWSSTIHIARTELLTHFALTLTRPFLDLFAEPESPASMVVVAACASLPLVAMVVAVRAAKAEARLMLLSLALVPVAIFLGPDLLFGGIRSLSARYLTVELIALVLAVAFALTREGKVTTLRLSLAALVIVLGGASVCLNAQREATWNKGISRALPQVTTALGGHGDALVIASREQHHPGNLLALAPTLDPRTTLLFAPYEGEFEIPDAPRPIYLFTLNPLLREFVERQTGLRARPLVQDLYADLWVLEAADAGRE